MSNPSFNPGDAIEKPSRKLTFRPFQPASFNPEDAIEKPGRKLTFLPAFMGEYVFDVDRRLSQLRDVLAEERWAFQRPNVLKAISMYESGELPLPDCREVWLMNGEVIGGFPTKINAGKFLWTEGFKYTSRFSEETRLRLQSHWMILAPGSAENAWKQPQSPMARPAARGAESA